MAFRKKTGLMLNQNPDILIVPECEHSDKINFGLFDQKPNNPIWKGDNQNKGLGIFSFGNYKIRLLDIYNPNIKIILPLHVTGEFIDFNLIAIWTNNKSDPDGQYVEQVWKAINFYDNLISEERILIAGDFNSNVIWDKTHRHGNHSDIVNSLKAKGIQSTYHYYFNQDQGNERDHTLFFQRKQTKTYHIDYCFASQYFIDRLQNVEIGSFNDWIKYSDHCPLTIDFKI
jgi:exonuclease III